MNGHARWSTDTSSCITQRNARTQGREPDNDSVTSWGCKDGSLWMDGSLGKHGSIYTLPGDH